MAAGPVRHVVLVGVPSLRWADVSAAATPALWRLARQGSVGSVSVTGVGPLSCPADGWLMLNAGARAAAPRTAAGSCATLPPVTAVRYLGRTGSGATSRPFTRQTVQIAQMPAIVAANQAYNENPAWGMLRSAAGPGECTTAVGPGAALALASRSGQVGAFLPGAARLTRAELARCPLTVVDLGALRAAPGPVRTADVRADDREIGRISAALPAGTILVVAGISDDAAPHLRLLVVRGPGFRSGLLVSPSTRQRGLALLLDLPVSVLHWLGLRCRPRRSGRCCTGPAGPAWPPRSRGWSARTPRRRSTGPRWGGSLPSSGSATHSCSRPSRCCRGAGARPAGGAAAWWPRVAGVVAACVPAGSFLASLVPWWTPPHPAVLLYSMTVAWALVIAVAALRGPWRHDPLGPPGLVAAATLGVIALDVMTGSHLQMGTPFGLSALVACGSTASATTRWRSTPPPACSWPPGSAGRRCAGAGAGPAAARCS